MTGEAERDEAAVLAGVAAQLRLAGQDPRRPDLAETPARVLRAFRELTSGYAEDPARLLARTFLTDNDELVLVRGIEFASLCEHHLLPFHGRATVGYLPGRDRPRGSYRIVGLSKIPRLVHGFARRLQVQETLTRQVARALLEHLRPLGVGVLVEATHLCMVARGVRASGATMVTSCLLGALRDDPAARAEFLALAVRRA